MIGNQPEAFREINVIPLVDVMLVLLIVFMATAPLLHQGLRVDLPDPGVEQARLDAPGVAVTIDAAGGVFVDGVATPDVAARLRLVPAHGDVSVHADRAVRYEVVADVIAAAQGAGVERVTLVVDGG